MHLMHLKMFRMQSFAIFGGVYAFASCIAQRLRQKQDGRRFLIVFSTAENCLMILSDGRIAAWDRERH